VAQTTHQEIVKLVQPGNDYTVRQLAVMVCCKKLPATVRDLAAELNVSRPVISRVADRLEELKFIRRIDDPEDRRSVLIELTAHGRKFIDSLT